MVSKGYILVLFLFVLKSFQGAGPQNLFLYISHCLNAWLYPAARKPENKSFLRPATCAAKNFILMDQGKNRYWQQPVVSVISSFLP